MNLTLRTAALSSLCTAPCALQERLRWPPLRAHCGTGGVAQANPRRVRDECAA
ncbi:hypothetical protein L226DRAFT_537276 [Lentinus tigrinus ALCF2SS1-7]|uniref:uncharacterized protein n=1 Tax=Lentinus tigrinus ALCF2SS1-7 TaxID=1328758 RepID=UPI0011662748|nr:hypothetical protein L226DRAFT_537276 [Lentinus tigrinus ALCF2SS1-7]